MKKKDSKLWFGKIESEEQAKTIIKEASFGLLIAAALLLIISFVVKINGYLDVIIFSVLALLLLKLKSRVVAVLCLIFSSLALVVTFSNFISPSRTGGSNIFLAGALVWVSIRAVQATIFLRKSRAVKPAN